MTFQKADGLLKPDMKAVLSRTHLDHDLHGFLLPVLEAISNSMDGIGSRFQEDKEKASQHGLVQIQVRNLNQPNKIEILVCDNGDGLTDANYKSFRTPFSGYKLDEKGRGFGRFIAFKVFSKILYGSRHTFFGQEAVREFQFDITRTNELEPHAVKLVFTGSGLQVEYSKPLLVWNDTIKEMKPDAILDVIGSHFLPYFLYRWLPQITIQFDDEQPQNITTHFQKIFKQHKQGLFLGRVDEFDQAETSGETDDRSEISGGLLAA